MTLPKSLFSPSLPIIIPVGILVAIGLLSIWTAAPVLIPTDGGLHDAVRAVLQSFFG